jgi:hypothetical protein
MSIFDFIISMDQQTLIKGSTQSSTGPREAKTVQQLLSIKGNHIYYLFKLKVTLSPER